MCSQQVRTCGQKDDDGTHLQPVKEYCHQFLSIAKLSIDIIPQDWHICGGLGKPEVARKCQSDFEVKFHTFMQFWQQKMASPPTFNMLLYLRFE
jgi:hypothetical protein